MEIIRHRQRVECSEGVHAFHWEDCPGAGFAFDVDESGGIVVTKGCALNVTRALLGFDPETGERIIDDGVEIHRWTYTEPAVGRCSCGEEVVLEGFTNTCDCGRDYNSGGQLLAPRSQWGEETGESLGDILRIP